ncbi:MAG TPA: hypothetical protein VNA24_22285 [Hyalangium sp.]|nr:hypothetical protein [Hyalangium sp.]
MQAVWAQPSETSSPSCGATGEPCEFPSTCLLGVLENLETSTLTLTSDVPVASSNLLFSQVSLTARVVEERHAEYASETIQTSGVLQSP